jgi:hypothetical protein
MLPLVVMVQSLEVAAPLTPVVLKTVEVDAGDGYAEGVPVSFHCSCHGRGTAAHNL